MPHTVKNVQLVFDGSSAEDVETARSFWRSSYLTTHHESRIISSDVNQLLPSAPKLVDEHGNSIRRDTKARKAERNEYYDLYRPANDKMLKQEIEMIERRNKWRMMEQMLLDKHRCARIQLEIKSKQKVQASVTNFDNELFY